MHGKYLSIRKAQTVIQPSFHPIQPWFQAAAAAAVRKKPAQITGTVTNQRHSPAPQGRQNQFSVRTVLHRFTGLRINHLNQQILVPQMIAFSGTSLNTAAISGLRHSPMRINSALPGFFQKFQYTLRHIIRT